MEGDFLLCEADPRTRKKSRDPCKPTRRCREEKQWCVWESVERQDHVSEPQCIEEENEEEMEELSFLPSAVSEPRWALHICDNKC